MKPAPFLHAAPESLDGALELLEQHGSEAKALAGGQSLMPLLNMRFAQPAVLVDLNRLPELGAIAQAAASIEVGATVRQSEFGASALVRDHLPAAAATVPYIGHFVTRNRGTVGGSLAHADARAELPLALLALGGSVRVTSRSRGARDVAADELFVTHFTTTLEPDELLVSSSWPLPAAGWRFAFEEFAQRHGDYALGMVCVGVELAGGEIRDARVAISAVTDRPVLLSEGRDALVGRPAGAETARAAGAAAAGSVEPHDDMHATARYRKSLTGTLIERACIRAFEAAA